MRRICLPTRCLLTLSSLALFLSAAESLIVPAARLRAPVLVRPDAVGHAINLQNQRGQVVILDFWATYCGGCKTEIPWFLEFARQHHAAGLKVIGVALDEQGFPVITPFLTKLHIDYPVVTGTDQLLEQYKITALPTTLLIDRQGRIALAHTGVIDRTAWDLAINQLLAEPAPH